jgi:hypothetical protein
MRVGHICHERANAKLRSAQVLHLPRTSIRKWSPERATADDRPARRLWSITDREPVDGNQDISRASSAPSATRVDDHVSLSPQAHYYMMAMMAATCPMTIRVIDAIHGASVCDYCWRSRAS